MVRFHSQLLTAIVILLLLILLPPLLSGHHAVHLTKEILAYRSATKGSVVGGGQEFGQEGVYFVGM
jgi:hypothetical protein